MKYRSHIIGTTLAIVASIAFFGETNTDIVIQSRLFDAVHQQWMVSKSEPIGRLLFYDGPKLALILVAIAIAVGLLFKKRLPIFRTHQSGLRIFLFSLILVPFTVATLKSATNVPCPCSLQAFGGDLPYVGVLDHYPAGSEPKERQRCFPAGHASGEFALMALGFLFSDPLRRRLAMGGGAAAGWVAGGYKMAIGDHFFSHTLVSMELAWLLICVLALLEMRRSVRRSSRLQTFDSTFARPASWLMQPRPVLSRPLLRRRRH